MMPALFGYLSGEAASSVADGKTLRQRFWKNALFFILGFIVVMMTLGAIASFIGESVRSIVQWVQVVAGFILILLGFYQMKILRFKLPNQLVKLETAATGSVGSVKPGYVRSFVAGMVIAPGWGPIFLGTVLLVITVNGNFLSNLALMFAYCLGFALMFLLSFLFFEPLRLLTQKLGDKMRRVEQAGGALMMSIGVLMVVGKLNWITDLGKWKISVAIKGLLGMN
ncbi:hypothetical protein BEP19_04215 [Ammoniphilus oxalaticus]|uniref:Cytochrome C biogenesis protein transmembrane domain-containing protein n=1 Tax=Ammoniphilus oxalaticus TaxID=66863 RepID=A0A419SLV1_9BACL|nr:cytochrome c biogenesis protein CcdA [Ammoniphilus oxalaticus]RKD25038.1 hypothetical protein BEP19_04215 [Ammoniphilus oxalaticus]